MKNPRTIKEAAGEKFDYFIERKHCRTDNPKMQLKNMCEACRQLSYLDVTLKKIKKQVLDVLSNKAL